MFRNQKWTDIHVCMMQARARNFIVQNSYNQTFIYSLEQSHLKNEANRFTTNTPYALRKFIKIWIRDTSLPCNLDQWKKLKNTSVNEKYMTASHGNYIHLSFPFLVFFISFFDTGISSVSCNPILECIYTTLGGMRSSGNCLVLFLFGHKNSFRVHNKTLAQSSGFRGS